MQDDDDGDEDDMVDGDEYVDEVVECRRVHCHQKYHNRHSG
jgi:essential nuclear protein 1